MVSKFFRMFDFLSFRMAIAAFGLISAFPIAAQQAVPEMTSQAAQPFVERYPAGSIQSVEAAEQAIMDINQERLRVEAQFSDAERVCYEKFFTTSCLDKAKEKKRLAMNEIRTVEVEANAFKRRAKAAKRDEVLEKKRADDGVGRQEDVPFPRADAASSSGIGQDGTGVGQATTSAATQADDRVARHRAEQDMREKKEAADAEKRARNVRKFERKQRESEERQRAIAAKKAEKMQKAERKKEAAKTEAAETLPAPEKAGAAGASGQ